MAESHATEICKIEECQNPKTKRGYCRPHYRRWLRYGDPLKGGAYKGVQLKWLKEMVKNPPEGCAEWPYSTITGYGQVVFEGRPQTASRVALILKTGENPKNMYA